MLEATDRTALVTHLRSFLSFVSLLSFDVFHSWLDDGGRSWGPRVSLAAWKGTECGHHLDPQSRC